MSTTRKDIRQRVMGAGFCNDGIASTATGGSTSTLVDTSVKQPDDAFNYGQVVILTGTAAGDRRYVTDWVQSTQTLTADRNFSAAIVSTNTYELHRIFTADEKDVAINEALRMAQSRWVRRVEDTSLTILSNTYTYSLAALTIPIDPDFGIDEVMYDSGASGTGAPYATLDNDFWRLRNNDGTLTLQLLGIPLTGVTLRLKYRVRPTIFSADTDALKPDTTNFYNFICAKATAILFDKQALKAGQDAREHWQVEAQKMHQLAEAYYGVDKPQAQATPAIYGLWGDYGGEYDTPIKYGEN